MYFAVASAHADNRHTIAVVSSLESANPLQDAIALLRATRLATVQSVISSHETASQDFWSKSSIKIEDQVLSGIWYQNLYFSRCVSKPGAQAVGLFAGPMLDPGGWHDNYTLSYNCQQTFWGNIITNHVEMVEPFTRVFERYMPRARWFSNETYGSEGAYCPHNLYRHDQVNPTTCVSNNNRMFAGGPWAYTLGNSGYAIHNIWLSYKYQPDPVHLAQHVYPILKDVGRFYINFVDLCALDGNGKTVLGPSVSPEHGNLGSTTARSTSLSASSLSKPSSKARPNSTRTPLSSPMPNACSACCRPTRPTAAWWWTDKAERLSNTTFPCRSLRCSLLNK